ncbi:MAG: glycosyltransferase [Acidobacteriia bacterium]|nr:glycosyltransferase [Terriglobia bacterium]
MPAILVEESAPFQANVDLDRQPVVSIITATYNRSSVLRFAVESVRRQTLSSWEMWVVGDGCTDDTADVIREIGDPRVRFVNLAQNCGDQSGPNNEAVLRARGRFLAYLNHDDLWFPDHLETAVRALNETGADLVWPLIVKMDKHGVFTCGDLIIERRYAAHLSVPASFWVMRRELADEVGPWRHHQECHATPSQDWLFRAGSLGKDLRYIPHFTAIALPSGGRPGAYANREHLENQAVFERIHADAQYREKVLIAIAEQASIVQANPPLWRGAVISAREFVRRRLAPFRGWPTEKSYTYPLAGAVRKRIRRWAGSWGVHPEAVELRLKYRRPGGFIQYLRRFRGLPPTPSGEGE